MPMPKSRATRLTVQTVGIRIICMSTSGSLLRASAITQTGSMTAAMTNSPITLPDVPAPVVALADADEQRDEPPRHAAAPYRR